MAKAFKSGNVREYDNEKEALKLKEDQEKKANEKQNRISREKQEQERKNSIFKGRTVTRNENISGGSRTNFTITRTGSLRVSGGLHGNIFIGGGNANISGGFHGHLKMTSGSINISGGAKGTCDVTGGSINVSGSNKLREI